MRAGAKTVLLQLSYARDGACVPAVQLSAGGWAAPRVPVTAAGDPSLERSLVSALLFAGATAFPPSRLPDMRDLLRTRAGAARTVVRAAVEALLEARGLRHALRDSHVDAELRRARRLQAGAAGAAVDEYDDEEEERVEKTNA